MCSASAKRRLVCEDGLSCPYEISNTMLSATAVAHCKVAFNHPVRKRAQASWQPLPQAGKGLVKVNGKPLALTQPEILRFKVDFSHLYLSIHPSLTRTTMTGLRATPHCRAWQICQCRHPRSCLRRWSYFSDLRYPPSHREVNCGILPEIRGRICEEPVEASFGDVRPDAVGGR